MYASVLACICSCVRVCVHVCVSVHVCVCACMCTWLNLLLHIQTMRSSVFIIYIQVASQIWPWCMQALSRQLSNLLKWPRFAYNSLCVHFCVNVHSWICHRLLYSFIHTLILMVWLCCYFFCGPLLMRCMRRRCAVVFLEHTTSCLMSTVITFCWT